MDVWQNNSNINNMHRAKHKHVGQLEVIVKLMNACRNVQDHVVHLGCGMFSFHAQTKKAEQKQVEQLETLEADDEEACMNIIDTAKDTRITHLLKQADTYLYSIAHVQDCIIHLGHSVLSFHAQTKKAEQKWIEQLETQS